MVQIVFILLAPLLYWQGRRTRRKIPRLPEPPGPRDGSSGSGPPLRVLVIGDSAAAGVGATHQDNALLGYLVRGLSETFTVRWKLEASTGATTDLILKRVSKLSGDAYDIAVTSLGVNDVTGGTSIRKWLQQQEELRQALRERLCVRHIYVAGLPPVGKFPAIPNPLRWFLGHRATQFNKALRDAIAAEPQATLINLRFTADSTLMAEDGFHPGSQIYEMWATAVCDAFKRDNSNTDSSAQT